MAYMYTISQMLIYNTYSTYHNTKTITIRNSKEHETPFLLYQGLNMHGDARLEKKTDQKIPRTWGVVAKGRQRHLVATLANTR